MSWRSNKTDKYHRAEENEYWMDIVAAQDDDVYPSYWYDDEDDRWTWFTFYGAPGYVQDMGEYHLLRTMTLLHKLNIKEAKTILTDHGW